MERRISRKARNNQLVEFWLEVKGYLNALGPQEDVLFIKYKTGCFTKGELMYEAHQIDILPSKTAELDTACDKTFIAIGKSLTAYAALESTGQLATNALRIWDTYGYDTTRKDIESELSDYAGFIDKMNAPTMQETLAAMDIVAQLLAQLTAQTNALREHKSKLSSTQAIRTASDNTTESSGKFTTYFNGPFWNFLVFMEQEDPDNYSELCHNIQGSINRINEVVKLRQTLAEKEEEESEDDETPGTDRSELSEK